MWNWCCPVLGVFGVISGIIPFVAYDSLYHYIMKQVGHIMSIQIN